MSADGFREWFEDIVAGTGVDEYEEECPGLTQEGHGKTVGDASFCGLSRYVGGLRRTRWEDV